MFVEQGVPEGYYEESTSASHRQAQGQRLTDHHVVWPRALTPRLAAADEAEVEKPASPPK
jgi:hypothetical protein